VSPVPPVRSSARSRGSGKPQRRRTVAVRRSFESAGRGRVHPRSSSGAGGTVGIGSRRFDRSAGTGWRAILWRTRRSGRSAPHPSGCEPADLKGGAARTPQPARAAGKERGDRSGAHPGTVRAPPDGWSRMFAVDPSGACGGRSIAFARHGVPLAWVRSMRAVAGCQVRPARARPIQTGLAAFSCRSPPAPEASGALRSGARCAGSFTGARRT
jgi:hypothetical protein